MQEEYSKEMAIDLFRQGFSIQSVVRRIAKKIKTTQRDIKPAVERDLFEYVMGAPMKPVEWRE